MKAFIHFKDGTQVIDGREYSGYEPCRSDRVLSIHIYELNYDIHIFPTCITIKHKYFALAQKTFALVVGHIPLMPMKRLSDNR